jgi:hypothetical protein
VNPTWLVTAAAAIMRMCPQAPSWEWAGRFDFKQISARSVRNLRMPALLPVSPIRAVPTALPVSAPSPPAGLPRPCESRTHFGAWQAPNSSHEHFRPGWFGDAMGTADGEIRCDILHNQAATTMSIGQITN